MHSSISSPLYPSCNNFKFVLDGTNVTTTGNNTIAHNVWYEREANVFAFFKSNGELAKSEWLTIGSYKYYFGDDYIMYANKWWKSPSTGVWYWLKSDGKMACSETVNINGKNYIFDANGACTNP